MSFKFPRGEWVDNTSKPEQNELHVFGEVIRGVPISHSEG